jgi:hypothetical protein
LTGYVLALHVIAWIEFELANYSVAKRRCRKCLKFLKGLSQSESLHRDEAFCDYYATDQLYLLAQIYEAGRQHRKAFVICELLRSCSPQYKPFKDYKTVTEMLEQIKANTGKSKVERYSRQIVQALSGELTSIWQVYDFITSQLLASKS